jgi:hypothetical protein
MEELHKYFLANTKFSGAEKCDVFSFQQICKPSSHLLLVNFIRRPSLIRILSHHLAARELKT